MSKPTRRQINFFARLRLPAPSTSQAASTLISYILDENIDKPDESIGERVRLLRCHHSWIGARIKITASGHIYRGLCGRLVSLRVRPPKEIALIRERHRRNPHPYVALVALGPYGQQRTYVPLSGLKVICRAEQELLFSL